MRKTNELFVFRRFMEDADKCWVQECHKAAVDKLQTLFPSKRITTYDMLTIGIETDCDYSNTGVDTYELGMVDEEIPALRNTRDGNVITFRV